LREKKRNKWYRGNRKKKLSQDEMRVSMGMPKQRNDKVKMETFGPDLSKRGKFIVTNVGHLIKMRQSKK
jgi:hypothetical protein